MRLLTLVFRLGKAPIGALAACSAATGYLLSPGKNTSDFLFTVSGVLILASGSAALNQWQEWRTDGLMERTRHRPIPAGEISPARGFAIAAILIFLGLGLVHIASAGNGTALGALAVLWYNGLYTPLKKVTAFAAVPGGVVGTLSPAIGWVAGGGAISDPQIFVLGAFLFVWQIPHFWLLQLSFGGDYENAGFPALAQVLTERQIGRMIQVWIVAAVAITFMLPFFGVLSARYFLTTLAPFSVWLFFRVRRVNPADSKRSFRAMNLFLLGVMVALSVTRWI